MKYFGGCDVGSTYTKTVILDENGAIVAANTIKSKINSAQSAKAGLDQAIADAGLKEIFDLTYLIGTGYGRNKVPQADENISEISCHAMGVHVTDPSVRAIIDIGGQDVKGIAVDTDGTVKTFAMNDKCAAGTGRFFESMANAFEMSLEEFSKLSLTAENVILYFFRLMIMKQLVINKFDQLGICIGHIDGKQNRCHCTHGKKHFCKKSDCFFHPDRPFLISLIPFVSHILPLRAHPSAADRS